ncbi:MAG TPA: molecular chaperone DnaJ [Caulobacteraceae bacterium]|jgi:hypothetical protein
MAFILVALAVVAALVWLGRNPRALKQGQWRPALGVIAVALIAGAAAFGVRGGWLPAVGLLLGGLAAAGAARGRLPPAHQQDAMSDAEARATLGVGPAATEAEIKDAYARLIRRTHPDAGGSAGLAAQLNAARDRLLRS